MNRTHIDFEQLAYPNFQASNMIIETVNDPDDPTVMREVRGSDAGQDLSIKYVTKERNTRCGHPQGRPEGHCSSPDVCHVPYRHICGTPCCHSLPTYFATPVTCHLTSCTTPVTFHLTLMGGAGRCLKFKTVMTPCHMQGLSWPRQCVNGTQGGQPLTAPEIQTNLSMWVRIVVLLAACQPYCCSCPHRPEFTICSPFLNKSVLLRMND